jgi:hypothetical protein
MSELSALNVAIGEAREGAEDFGKVEASRLRRAVGDASAEAARCREEVGVLEGRLEATSLLAARDAELEALRARVDAVKGEVAALRGAAAGAGAPRGPADPAAAEALRRELAAFARFGLDFEASGDGGLELRFARVDARAPSRSFLATLRVDGDDRYAVSATYPTLPAARLGALLADVNDRNDFAAFVRALRSEFAALCAAPATRDCPPSPS